MKERGIRYISIKNFVYRIAMMVVVSPAPATQIHAHPQQNKDFSPLHPFPAQQLPPGFSAM